MTLSTMRMARIEFDPQSGPIEHSRFALLLMAALVTVLVLFNLLLVGGATGLFRALMGAGSAAGGSVARRVAGLLRHG
jgi:hypothetical protein